VSAAVFSFKASEEDIGVRPLGKDLRVV
jgi:hypothetical protein